MQANDKNIQPSGLIMESFMILCLAQNIGFVCGSVLEFASFCERRSLDRNELFGDKK